MEFRQIVSEGLSHISYFLADQGEAVVIDPRRDIDVYLQLARETGSRIRYVLETHRNEDYVIGSTALVAVENAEVLHSDKAEFQYGQLVVEGDKIRVGRLEIKVLETPGHTDESLTFAVADKDVSSDSVWAFTGDALFVGEEGRVDLYGNDEKASMAEALYESIHDKILPLGDGVILCPAHGGGSVCGGNILDRRWSTLGFERLNNPKLGMSREAFVRAKKRESHVRPPYFERMEEWNLNGTAPIYETLPVLTPLSPGEFNERMQAGAVVIDTRMPQAFAGGHIPGSYNIWFEGLSGYLGWVIEPGVPFMVILPEGVPSEWAIRSLLRLGYDEVIGFLKGGFESWQNQGLPVERIHTIDTQSLIHELKQGERLHVLDVRKPGELQESRFPGAQSIFVGELESRLDEVSREASFPILTLCSMGHRGSLAASILAKHGWKNIINYLGGMTAWNQFHKDSHGVLLNQKPPARRLH